jgi:hypothetical protein
MAIVNLLRRLFSLLGRRAHRREPRAMHVEWHLFGSGVRHRSTTGDFGEGGAFLTTPDTKPAGSPVVLELAHEAGAEPRTVHARVAWSGTRGMGLRFTRPFSA